MIGTVTLLASVLVLVLFLGGAAETVYDSNRQLRELLECPEELLVLPKDANMTGLVIDCYYSDRNYSNCPNGQPVWCWDTSQVTNMDLAFYRHTSFNKPLDLWNTTSVTSMEGMFASAFAFNQPLDNFNTTAVTSMWSMFAYASSFNQPLDNFDTTAVTDMFWMFYDASAFNQCLGSWNRAKADRTKIFTNSGCTYSDWENPSHSCGCLAPTSMQSSNESSRIGPTKPSRIPSNELSKSSGRRNQHEQIPHVLLKVLVCSIMYCTLLF